MNSITENTKSKSNELIVLKKCRLLMKYLGLNVESNLHTFEAKLKISIAVWVIRLIYSIPMCTCCTLAFWHIIDKNLDLTASSVAVIIIVGGGHSQVIYFSLIAQNNSIINIIDQLQKLVDTRKCRVSVEFCLWIIFRNHILKIRFASLRSRDIFERQSVLWRSGEEKRGFGETYDENVRFGFLFPLHSSDVTAILLCSFWFSKAWILDVATWHKV